VLIKKISKTAPKLRKQTTDLVSSKRQSKGDGRSQQTKGPSIKKYSRKHDLINLLALWPVEMEDTSLIGTEKIIKKIKSALRAERNRGQCGHWSYNLNRHVGLKKALKGEQETLKRRAELKKGSASNA